MNDYPTPALYIDGCWITAGSGGGRPVTNPADGTELAVLPLAGEVELERAVAAAQRGFALWRATPAHARHERIASATRLLRERADAIARIMTLEQGKPLAESRREVLLSADIIDFLAEEGKRAYGRLVPPRSDAIFAQAVTRVPVGPSALFTPWNFPMNLPARKVGAALAAGCSAILKPAEDTPGSAIELLRAFHDAGLPAGVLNLVCGDPAQVSSYLIAHPGIRKVSFTGSIPVGKQLGELCARGVKRYTAELGGHAPVLVLPDADAAHVAKLSVTAKYRNAGQVCASPTRFLVHRSLFDPFVAAFAAGAQALRVGNGLAGPTSQVEDRLAVLRHGDPLAEGLPVALVDVLPILLLLLGHVRVAAPLSSLGQGSACPPSRRRLGAGSGCRSLSAHGVRIPGGGADGLDPTEHGLSEALSCALGCCLVAAAVVRGPVAGCVLRGLDRAPRTSRPTEPLLGVAGRG